MICELFEMGFKDEKIERLMIYTKLKSIEGIIDALVPDEKGLYRHTLVTKRMAETIVPRVKHCNIRSCVPKEDL